VPSASNLVVSELSIEQPGGASAIVDRSGGMLFGAMPDRPGEPSARTRSPPELVKNGRIPPGAPARASSSGVASRVPQCARTLPYLSL
jgi:hypothetical protein